jgi:formate dehydrogenase major subunit
MENQFKVILNNKECTAYRGETILSALKRNGWDVPTLCHGDGLEPFAGCSICSVEVAGRPKLMASCSTLIEKGMEITSESQRVYDARKSCLELLLSNHYGDCLAPCTLECPAEIDIQGYLAHAANGDYRAALKLIKEKNPMPRTIGRVCPHTCESVCRRNLVDEPLAINPVKRFVADWDAAHAPAFRPAKARPTNKKIAVIGAGPSGLSAAWYLALAGHDVEIFERLPKAGGMLRYGIPRYRLPAEVLDWEINHILSLGIKVHTNIEFNDTFNLESLEKQGFDAVYAAIGAHSSSGMRIEGEQLKGVVAGIDFLRELEINGSYKIGPEVVVVGGGNTAIDTARTALRLGCSKVSVYYRRTENEMPAEDYEVKAAKEEGIEFVFLAAPVKALAGSESDGSDSSGSESGSESGSSGRLSRVRFIKMQLGEPDSSGRRRPVPVEGSEFDVKADTLIAAIGQKPESNLALKAGLAVNSWGGIDADEYSGLGKGSRDSGSIMVFAGGDCVTGAATAIKGIGAGRRAAMSINAALLGLNIPEKGFDKGLIVKKGLLEEMPPEEFEDYEKIERAEIPEIEPETRRKSFIESELTMDEATILKEAARCLECGCEKVFSCELKKWADQSKIIETRYKGEMTKLDRVTESGLIQRDRNKCILCNKCIRTCNEVAGLTALGLKDRGFLTTVEPAMGKNLCETDCNFCGMCIDACPTQALSAVVPLAKPGPFKTETIDTSCSLCPAACPVKINTSEGKIISVTGYDGNKNHENTKNRWSVETCAFARFAYASFNERNHAEGLSAAPDKTGMPAAPERLKEKIEKFANTLNKLGTGADNSGLKIIISAGIGDKALKSLDFLIKKLNNPGTIIAGVPAGADNNIFGPVKFEGNQKVSPVSFGDFDFTSPDILVIAMGLDLGETSPVLAGTLRSLLLAGGSVISVDSDLTKRVNNNKEFNYSESDFDKMLCLIKGDESRCGCFENIKTVKSVIVLAGKDLDEKNSAALKDALDKKSFAADAFFVPVHSFTNLHGVLSMFGSRENITLSSELDFSYMPSLAPRAWDKFDSFKDAALDLIANYAGPADYKGHILVIAGVGIMLAKGNEIVEYLDLLPVSLSGETVTDLMGNKVGFNVWYGSKDLTLNEAINAIGGHLK